jgi:chemotaxis-related protein WspB
MLALAFQVGADRVAVDVRRVHEVVPRVRLSPATGSPAWVAGVFVYHGRVVPVVDLHALMGVGECPPHLSSRVILLRWPRDVPESLVGLLATQVAEIRAVRDSPRTDPRAGNPGLGTATPDGTGILRVLDADELLAWVAAQSAGLIAAGVGQ